MNSNKPGIILRYRQWKLFGQTFQLDLESERSLELPVPTFTYTGQAYKYAGYHTTAKVVHEYMDSDSVSGLIKRSEIVHYLRWIIFETARMNRNYNIYFNIIKRRIIIPKIHFWKMLPGLVTYTTW